MATSSTSTANSTTNILTDNNDRTPATPAEVIYKLSFLCSLISKSFDGTRTELHEFISNCNNAFRFANDQQKDALIAFVISKITGSAKAQLRDKTIQSWAQLKGLLLQLYSDKKHYTQLMEELNTIRQNTNETVNSFYNRVDKLCTRLLNCLTCQNENERVGRVETIKELSLQRFILHSNPDISRFLRAKELKTLSDAFNSAIEEERALQISKSSSSSSSSYTHKYCNHCKTKSHFTKDCFKKRNVPKEVHFNKPFSNDTKGHKVCNYCKKQGHIISECFKRKRNNENKNNSNNSGNTLHEGLNRVNLNEVTSGNSVVSTDWE